MLALGNEDVVAVIIRVFSAAIIVDISITASLQENKYKRLCELRKKLFSRACHLTGTVAPLPL